MELKNIVTLIDTLLYIAERGVNVRNKMIEARKFIIDLDGRDPTDEEWAQLRQRLEIFEDIIEEAAERARQEMEQREG